jgi:HEAT repeat protein
MGPQMQPHLLRWMDDQGPSLGRRKADEFLRKSRFLEAWATDEAEDDGRESRAWCAAYAFSLIGPEATYAIPALKRRLERANPAFGPTCRAALALSYLGKEGLPPLVAGLTNRNSTIRDACAKAVWRYGTNGAIAVPGLMVSLGDRAVGVRWTAAECLGSIHQEPDKVVPALAAKRLAKGASRPAGRGKT